VRHLTSTLERVQALALDWSVLKVPSPFALALMVERLREQLTTEKLKDRLDRILAEATRVLDDAPRARRRG